jgi:hypothetical protein
LVNRRNANEESPLSGLIPCLTRPHDAIVTAYKQRSQQQAVGIVIRPGLRIFLTSSPSLWLPEDCSFHEHVIQGAFMKVRIIGLAA